MDKTHPNLKEMQKGMEVEKEHLKTVGGKISTVKKIVLDHLAERPDYYSMLEKAEKKKTHKDVLKFRQKRGMSE